MSQEPAVAAPGQDVADAGLGKAARATLTWLAGWGQQLFITGLSFVATPLLLVHLGAERLGAFRAAEQWAGYVSIFSIGLTQTVSVLLLRAYNSGDPGRVSAVLRTGLGLMARQALYVLPIVVIGALCMPFVVPVPPDLMPELRWGALVAMLGMLALSPLGALRQMLECAQRGYLVRIGLTLQSLVITLAAVGLAMAGGGLYGQFGAVLLGAIVFTGFLVWTTRGELARARQTAGATVPRRELWGLRWPLAVAELTNTLSLLSDFALVGLLFGPVMVTKFVLTQRLVLFLGALINNISNVTWAGLGALRATGSRQLFEDRVAELLRLIVGLGALVAGTIALHNEAFVTLWVGEAQYGGMLLSLGTAAQAVVFGFVAFFAWTIDTQGDARHRILPSVVGAVTKVGLALLFAQWLGLAGLPLGTVCGYLVAEAWVLPRLFCRLYEVRMRVVLVALVRSLAVAGVWLAGVWWMVRAFGPVETWPELILRLGAALAGSAVVFAVFVLTGEDRRNWRVRLERLRRRG